MGQVLASVLTPVLNEEEHIRQTVEAMRNQRVDGEFELLFMDGGSDDRTREILDEIAAEDARVRVFDNPGKRVPHALNIGLRHARGAYIVRMDGHAYYPDDYIALGIARLQRGDVGWVTGPGLPEGVGPWSRAVAVALSTWLGRGGSRKWAVADAPSDAAAPDEEVELDTGVFAGVWRRETVERLGGWDEGWPVNQDSEMAARFRYSGGRIVCLRSMGARYIPRDDLPGLARQYYRYGYYRAKTAKRHPSSLRPSSLFAPALTLGLPASLMPRPVSWPARAALGAYAALVLVTAAREAAAHQGEAIRLPAVFAAMHFGWGIGFLTGTRDFGVPRESLRRLVA